MATGFADLLGRFGAAPAAELPSVPVAKQEQVATAAQTKKQAMGMPSDEEMYRISAARANGSGSSITNPIQRDILGNSIWQNLQKYGAAAGDIAGNRARADTAFSMDRNATRSSQEAIGDAGVSVLGGAASSVLGIGALGLGLVNDQAGGYAATKVGQFNELVQDNGSDGLNARRRAYGAVQASDTADSTARYEQDLKDGKNSFVSSLSRIGRDAVNAVGNAAEDGTILSDGIANGVGSLLVGGPIAKGLAKVGGLALKGATMVRPSLLLSERAAKIAALGSKAAMPASIGLMEGGGTYQQTYEQAYAMLGDRPGMTEERRVELANKAALEAAAVQTPLAAATGVLTSKFEASPFRVPTLRSAAGNLIKEAVEEGVQSGTSQLGTNLGIRDQVDGRQSLSEGVGEQVGLGALYGMGTAGAVQTPGAALRSAIDAAKLTGRGVAAGVNKVIGGVAGAVNARADQVTQTLQNQSPTAPAVMDRVYSEAVAAAPLAQAETVQAINNATDVTPEQKTATLDYIDQFFNQVKFNDQEADQLPSPVSDIVRGSANRFEAIQRAAAAAVDENVPAETRLMSALYLEGEVAKHAPGLQDTIERIPDEHPALDQLRSYEDVMLNLGSDIRVAQAVKVARDFAQNFNADDVSDANIATDKGQTAAQNVATAASIDPVRVDPTVIDTVLKHATSGKVQLTNDQRAYLQAAKDLNQVEQDYQAAGGKLGLTNSEIVTRQIRSDKGNKNSTGYSAAEHLSRVFEAMRIGKTDIARERMDELTSFAQSLQNKVAALNESLAGGKGEQVGYQAYNPNTKQFFKSTTPVFVNARSENSVQTAQNVALDAEAVRQVHSRLARAFPQLGFASIEPNQLDADILNQPADQAVRAYKQKIQRANDETRRLKTADRLSSDTRAQGRSDTEGRPSQDRTNIPARSSDQASTPDQGASVSAPVQPQAVAPSPREERRQSETAPAPSPVLETTSSPEVQETALAQEASEPVAESSSEKVKQDPSAEEAPVQSADPEEAAPAVQDDVVTSDDGTVSSPSSPIDAAYPNLLGSPEGRGRNLFKQAFNLPVEAISRLTGVENPVQTIRDALSSGTKFRALVGQNAGDTKLTEETSIAYGKLLGFAGRIGKAMNQQLNDALAKNQKFIESREDWHAQKEYRAANISDLVDGKLTYNGELQQNAVLAGLQWFLQADQRQRPLSEEDVAKILGFEPTTQQVDLFNQGLYYDGAVQDLTDTVTRYWGVKPNPNTGMGIVRGVPEGVAKELIRAMEAAGLIQTNEFKVGNKTYRQISFNTEKVFDQDERKALMSNPTMIEMAAMVEPEQIMFVGTPPSTTPKTQLRNPEVQLTAQQTQMVEKEQKTPFYVVPHMLDFLRAIGPNGAVGLFGHGDIDNKLMNEAHKQALTSVNRTVYAAFESIDAMASLAEQKASDAGTAMTEMPIYYAYEFTSVNRLQMLGKHNPQANKLTREVIMPTRSTVDLSGETDDMSRFWLAVAQAWGEKVHKQQRAVSVTKARAMAEGQFKPAIDLLSSWLRTGDVDAGLTDTQVAELKAAFNKPGESKPVAPVAFYAAMEIARLNNTDKANRSAFQTSLYVEADGITDGPMNAMVHTAAGNFSPTWIETLRKGGLYLDRPGATSNDQGNIPDLYQVTADGFKNALSTLQQNVSGNGAVYDSLNSLIRLSGSLMGDLTYDPATNQLIDVSRGAVKNPLTVVIYGAGDRGIANKITSTLVKAIYERLSAQLQFSADNPKATLGEVAAFLYPNLDQTEAEKAYGQHEADVARLTNTHIEMLDGQLTSVDAKLSAQDLPKVPNTDPKFEFTAAQLKNMQENILTMFVQPLQEGIQANIGETVNGTTMLRQATQVQSIYLQYAYQRAVQAALDKREQQAKTDGSGWTRSDFLSQRELQDVRAKLKYLSPFIETGTQNMLISSSERTPILTSEDAKGTVEFSRSLDGKGSTGGYMSAPQDSGVSGIPKTVIGTGDGQMMQNFSVNPNIGDGYMLIFDGANFRLSDVEDYSRSINEAVHTGWMANPLGSVSKTFTDFIRLANLEQIDPEQLKALTFALTGKQGSMNPTDAVAQIKQLQNSLTAYAQDVQARKNVLAKVQMSVDHMASAGASFVSTGAESLEGLTTQQAADRLNQMLAEERARMSQESRSTAAPASDTLTVVSGAQLTDLVRAIKLTGDDKKLFAEVVRNAQDLGYRIVSGNQEQIDDYANENGLKQVAGLPGEQVNGYTVPADRAVYLVNPSEETLLHELIHASTIGRVQSYYLQDSKLSAEKTEAVARIESLMREWLANTDAFSDLNQETRQAAMNARSAIRAQLQGSQSEAMNRAGAVNEFMAWVLANQNLSQVAASTRVSNPIARIVKDVLAALKNLLGIRAKVGDDLLSNLRFNTQVLLAGPRNPGHVLGDTILFQSGNFGTNDRLTQLGQQFTDKIARKISSSKNPAARLTETLKASEANIVADQVTTSVIANGFPMDMQAKSTFQMMLAAFSADIALDPNAFGRAQELFTHVSKTLKVEDFMANRESLDPADRYQAQAKYDTVVGTRGVQVDQQGRSTLVPTFLALATVDENLRSVLAQMDLPKGERLPGNSVDNVATNMASSAMERLSVAMAGERQNSTSVNETLDALVDQIASITQDRTGFIDQMATPVGNAIDAANTWMVDTMSAMSKEIVRRADKLKSTTSNKTLSTGADFAKLLAGVVDKDVAGALSQSVMSQINKSSIWQPVADLMNELVGRTEENANVYDMIKQVRSVIQSLRQQYREHLPELIQKQFSRELTDAEQTAMFRGLAKTDIAALRSAYSVSQILELATDPSKLATQTNTVERRVRNAGSQVMIDKAHDLAGFMMTGKAPANLYRNAYAIAQFSGNTGVTEAPQSLVNDIDHLVSLYALGGLNQIDRQALASLVQDEAEGMNFVVSYLEGQRKDELLGAVNNPTIQANHYKGYVPSEQQGGVGLIVADDADFVELRKRGYERVSDYEGADAEYGKARKGYYFSPVSGKSAYSQGILQTVHTTVSGINAATGFTTSMMTAGRITDPQTVERISKLIGRKSGGKEQLLPVFDGTGKVVAYERSVDPLELQRLNASTHLSKMLGAWRGRQAEEAMAGKYNEALIDRLHKMWETPDKLARKSEFVNLLDKRELARDSVLADAVKLIPYDSLDYIREKFGDARFMVRRDMLNDALGYRQASVGDAWTGTTRWSPEVQKGIQNIATAVFGVDAYKRMIQGEKFIQNRVTDARVMIVVKSIVVPLTNLIANVYQLAARGVPIAQTVRSMPKKTAEIDGYVKGRLRKIELEGLLRASTNDVVAQRKHSAEIQSIEDSWKRLSIWPLIEAGEFTSVSDVGLGKEDIDITEARLSAYVEKLVDKMPEGVKTAAKYAIVSKDTALFKGLQKTVEYGDFLAKAVLFDDLTDRQGKTAEQALGEVTEEFVNYDRLPGRARSYLDNMGLLWFWNFKVRSAKIAVSMIRNNPLHAMLSMVAPSPPFIGSVGNPITDNILAVAADGRLDNSMGPSQGFRSMQLLPWLNLAG